MCRYREYFRWRTAFAFCKGWRSACADSWTCYLCFPTVSYYADTRILSTHLRGDLEMTWRDLPFNKMEAYISLLSQSWFSLEWELTVLPLISVYSYMWWLYVIKCALGNWPDNSFQSGLHCNLRGKMITFNPLNHLGISHSCFSYLRVSGKKASPNLLDHAILGLQAEEIFMRH